MRSMKTLSVFLVCLFTFVNVGVGQSIPEQLQEISVGIRAANSEGSGVVVNRTLKDGNQVTLVVTAAHVVDGLKKTVNGKIGFNDAKVVQQLQEGGRKVGELLLDSQVIRWADPELEDDIAILLVRKNNFFPKSAEFITEEQVLPVGTEVILCGSPAGVDLGFNSVTVGIISSTGRVLPNGKVFDQTDAGSTFGSSGCGVYEKSSGKFCGMLQRGVGNLGMMGYFAPQRRLLEWGKEGKMLWVFKPDAEDLPTLEEFKKLPVVSEALEKREKEGVKELIPISNKINMKPEFIPFPLSLDSHCVCGENCKCEQCQYVGEVKETVDVKNVVE